MSRFRETVKAYVDAPIIDQWTSVIGERFTTSGLQLRARSYMRKNGRMVCASCMEAIPDNEMVNSSSKFLSITLYYVALNFGILYGYINFLFYAFSCSS